MKNPSASLAKLLVGAVLFGVCLIVFVGSGFGSSFAPSVGEGKLGASTTETISRVFEVVLSLLTALAGTGLFAKFPWMAKLIEILGPLFAPTQSPEDKLSTDMLNLLAHAVSQKNKDMTIMLCEELAGEAYMTEKTSSRAAK